MGTEHEKQLARTANFEEENDKLKLLLEEQKTVAKLKYELQLAREGQDRAESIAVEAEAAAAAPPFSIGRSCQTWGNRQVVASFRSLIETGSFSSPNLNRSWLNLRNVGNQSTPHRTLR